MQNKFRNSTILVVLSMLLIFSSCNHDNRNHPGYTYFNDMAPSEAYEYYSINPNFTDGKTAQPPVAGTIARGAIPYQYQRTDSGQVMAGINLKNPLLPTEQDYIEAQEIYKINCAMCHGETGKGDGHLVTSRKFNTEVTSLVDDFVQNKPDGEIFHVITMGSVSGFMGSHSAQIKPEDRWKVVSYIKNKLEK
ncbi:MAG: cytochrome c [Bacteroidetes bacterium]|jgi:hypothetical protein|nr:cytochrome c [Bacteroidota bacterium]MBT6687851.1 cytochrome c [Bacteroidota bacterium]